MLQKDVNAHIAHTLVNSFESFLIRKQGMFSSISQEKTIRLKSYKTTNHRLNKSNSRYKTA